MTYTIEFTGDMCYSHESNESLIELCTNLTEMHAQVYEELNAFVAGMMA